jgi:hypothetical protein
VSVAPPCDCSAPVDVGSIVKAFATTNDDAANHVGRTVLDQPTGPVDLPCGRYYVDGIHGGSVTIEVHGRVALFVDGDLAVDQALVVRLDAGAELDLFVAGNVALMGTVTVGDTSAPAHVRIYVGAGLTVSANNTSLSANVYAPNATVALATNFTMRGAIFAKALQFSGTFDIEYDTAVLQVPGNSGCQPSGGGCTSCNDCSGATPACIGGTCRACVIDADCCAPLRCTAGRCGLPTQ